MSKILSARYQKYKERIQKKPRERYQNLSEEEKWLRTWLLTI